MPLKLRSINLPLSLEPNTQQQVKYQKGLSCRKNPKIFLHYYGRMKCPNILFPRYLSFYGKKTFLLPLLLPKAFIPYTHECTLRLTDQSEWVLPELTSTFALIKLLYPTPCFWASSRAIAIMVRDCTWQESASHRERLASTPFLW